MKNRFHIILSGLLLLSLSTACSSTILQPSAIPVATSPSNPVMGLPTLPAYPGSNQPLPYPPPTIPNAAYPGPMGGSTGKVVPFMLDKPIYAGTTEIRGTGPAGIPIIIGDVTFNGEQLGTGTIGSDGTFVVPLAKPVEKAHRIGVGIGDLKRTQWASSNFSDPGYFGKEFQQVPMVGFYYDTAMVQPK